MDLHQLKSFVTVAEASSLTKASSLLFLSQPAISAQIKALETELGVILFDRTARGMGLTPAGQTLKQEAQRVLAAAKDVLSRAQRLRDELSGDCCLGAISEPTVLHVAELLAHLLERHPKLSPRVTQHISGTVIEQVLNGGLHAGYVMGEVAHPRIAAIPLPPVRLRVVGPYGWKTRIRAANWTTLAKLPWILTPAHCAFSQVATGMFARHGLAPEGVVVVDSESLLNRLVIAGLGMAIVRESTALEAETRHELAIWPSSVETCPLSFVYPHADAGSPLIRALSRSVRHVWKLPPDPTDDDSA